MDTRFYCSDGQRHSFAGGFCIKCRASQNPPKEIKQLKFEIKTASPNIHSDLHDLVNETRKLFGETAKDGKGSFGFYLKMFKRLGNDWIYMTKSELKQKGKEKEARLFWWLAGKEFEKRKLDKSQSKHIMYV